MRADGARAGSVFLGARQVAYASRADVAVFAEFFMVDYLEPGVDSHTLNSAPSALTVSFVLDAYPFVFGRNAVGEVDPPIDEFGRRQHALTAFDDFLVGRIEFGYRFSVADADFDPLFQADDFLALFGMVLALEEGLRAGFWRLGFLCFRGLARFCDHGRGSERLHAGNNCPGNGHESLG